MNYKPGILSIKEYNEVINSDLFRKMEIFSNNFLAKNKDTLKDYSKKWVADPLHSWSRQYEYPFVFYYIVDYIKSLQQDDIKILDAASGITFFPYYLADSFDETQVDCCDYDQGLAGLFEKVNSGQNKQVNFLSADIRKLPQQDSQYDILYCVSALEHTDNFEKVTKEFRRVLKKQGLLIVTFDLSLDGTADISLDKAKKLFKVLADNFTVSGDITAENFLNSLAIEKSLNTKYIYDTDKKLLPWKYPVVSFIKALMQFKIPNGLVSNIACGTLVLKNNKN